MPLKKVSGTYGLRILSLNNNIYTNETYEKI